MFTVQTFFKTDLKNKSHEVQIWITDYHEGAIKKLKDLCNYAKAKTVEVANAIRHGNLEKFTRTFHRISNIGKL